MAETNSTDKIKICIVDDDEFSLENISLSLSSNEYEVDATGNSDEAIHLLNNKNYDIAIIDYKLLGTTGLDIIEKIKKPDSYTKYILITGYSEEEAFIRANRIGVSEILKKPYEEFHLLASIKKLLHIKKLEEENVRIKEKLHVENTELKKEIEKKYSNDQNIMVGQSPKLIDSLNKARSVASYSINTLIVGETGTGKELLARFIKRNGARKTKSFVAVNCAALTESLFESELFGYEKGAFTNALQSRAGLFEVANGGILFLDEITEIPILLQAKLLRVIEESRIKRVGSTKEIKIDVQILSSTNRNVYDAIKKGFLREDLYHRIASTVIELPPLRERKEDLKDLVNHFYGIYTRLFNKETAELPDEFWKYVYKSDWEGNIREFSNFIKNYVLFGIIQESEHLPTLKPISNKGDSFLFMEKNFEELDKAKYWLIDKVLKKYDGNKTLAAKHLGVSYQGLVYLLKRNH